MGMWDGKFLSTEKSFFTITKRGTVNMYHEKKNVFLHDIRFCIPSFCAK